MERTTIELLTGYLPRYGWPAFVVVEDTPDGGKILTGWRSPLVDETKVLFLVVDHSKNVLFLVVPTLVSAPQAQMPIGQLADVLTALGLSNFAMSLGRYAYDPRDGEIRFEYDMPIDGAAITFEQFKHMLDAATAAVTYWAPRLAEVAKGERTGGSVTDSFFRHVKEFAG